jgi:hypothetical protein
MPIITQTRDSVVTTINGASLTPIVEAEAAYEATIDLDTFSGARLLVIPRNVDPDLVTHDDDEERQITIDVILQYRCNTLDPDELDPYLQLAESIEALMIGNKPSTSSLCAEVKWLEGTWNVEHLEKFKVLTIPLALTFNTYTSV